MKRTRYLELAKLADGICLNLLNAKISPDEGCIVRQIAETQWSAMKVQYYERQGGSTLSNTVDCPESAPLSDNV